MSEYTTIPRGIESDTTAKDQCRLSNSGISSQKSPSAEKTDTESKPENPPYYHQVTHESWPGVVASVDMIRQNLSLRSNRSAWLIEHLDTVMSDGVDFYTANRVGKYQSMWTFKFGDETATVGVGLVGLNNVDMTKGFFEFNPNKLGDVREFYGIRRVLDEAGARFSTARFDMAFDLPGERKLYQLVKDRRKYEYHNGGAVSEYLGCRNRIGRVKLYDKSAESGLSVPLTRLEITVGEFDTALKAWPHLVGLETIQHMTSSGKALVKALGRLAELGDPVEPYLEMLDKQTKSRYMRQLKKGFQEFPLFLVCELYKQVSNWNDNGFLRPND